MLTIKHLEWSGHESIREVREVAYQPANANEPEIVFGFDSPGIDGALQYGDGKIFVMNDHGKTVAIYDLQSNSCQGPK